MLFMLLLALSTGVYVFITKATRQDFKRVLRFSGITAFVFGLAGFLFYLLTTVDHIL